MADEDPDDPQLKALRAVWLSMRDNDEDPPDSGVSALMAAARSQAMQMAPAPWWKRLLDQLRRPPVLALASLLVLIGGAVLLTKHDAIEKALTSTPIQEKELPHSNLDIGGAPPPVAPGTVSPHLQPDDAKDKQQATPPAPVHRHPTPHTTAGKGTGEAAGTIMPAPQRTDDAFESGDSRPAAAHKSAADAPPPNQVLVDQLAAQARRAAKRGDCENAKAIATRIAGQDATYYRDHVAGDVAACLQAPAAADTAAH